MSEKPTQTWRVTFHDGDNVEIQAAEITVDPHTGVGFWDNLQLVASVASGSYRSVVREEKPSA